MKSAGYGVSVRAERASPSLPYLRLAAARSHPEISARRTPNDVTRSRTRAVYFRSYPINYSTGFLADLITVLTAVALTPAASFLLYVLLPLSLSFHSIVPESAASSLTVLYTICPSPSLALIRILCFTLSSPSQPNTRLQPSRL